jgi:PKD repeat protein
LNQFTTAKFTASSPDVAVNATVTFSNWNANVTSCAWNFGDGGTSTSTSNKVTHVYTSVGTWTVSLTATDGSGTETLTRNNYITTYGVPVSSFTYTSGTLTHPVTVNFVNTSGEEYAKWAFYDNSGFMATSNRLAGVVGQNVAFTYTNAGTFKVTMQASNPGGSGNIVTNSIIVN